MKNCGDYINFSIFGSYTQGRAATRESNAAAEAISDTISHPELERELADILLEFTKTDENYRRQLLKELFGITVTDLTEVQTKSNLEEENTSELFQAQSKRSSD
jgi:hypothetical protein